MEERIPDKWKTDVREILEKGDPKRISITTRAVLDFQSLFPGAFMCEIYDAFIDALANPNQKGKRVEGMEPEGETYGFIFRHRRKDLYGKVCLTTDGNLVVIFSAHIPLKGDKP